MRRPRSPPFLSLHTGYPWECAPTRRGGSLLRDTAGDIRTAMLTFQIWIRQGAIAPNSCACTGRFIYRAIPRFRG